MYWAKKATTFTIRQADPKLVWFHVLALLLVGIGGCATIKDIVSSDHDTQQSYFDNHGLKIEYPEVAAVKNAVASEAKAAVEPHVLQDPSNLPEMEMTLQQAIQLAVQQSPVLRNIGGTIVSTTQGAQTIYDPSLAAANPLSGTEAALAAFDAQLSQQLFWTKTDQPVNIQAANPAFAGFFATTREGTGGTYIGDLSKQTAQGARFALRHQVEYNWSNNPQRLFPSDFVGWIEAEWRQPMMRGAGTEFNRIAGPNGQVGQYNGVLIARVTEDVALADFEAGLISLVADVEQAYWDLATAYRILESQLKGRASALQTFQYQQVRLEVGSGRSDEEAQAQSQYYQFQAAVESSLGGQQGLYQLEQRLRYLIGLAATDGRLIKPTTDPMDAPLEFDWSSALGQALERRVEIRRQKLNVHRREMELRAARLNLRPRLDFLGQYRWRGLGDHLIGSTDAGFGNNLYQSITDGNFQEWRAGLEMDLPVGLRAAGVAVSHAKLNLQRERALLAETELRISHDLSDAARQIKLTQQLTETNYNRYLADLRQVEVLERRYRDGSDNINFLLQAQRQVIDSETAFYRSLADYNLAIRDLHQQKGSLLAYSHVTLAEGPWCRGAYDDAREIGKFLTPNPDASTTYRPAPVSRRGFNPSQVQSPPPASTNTESVEPVQPLPQATSPQLGTPNTEETPADKPNLPPRETTPPSATSHEQAIPPAPKTPMDFDFTRKNDRFGRSLFPVSGKMPNTDLIPKLPPPTGVSGQSVPAVQVSRPESDSNPLPAPEWMEQFEQALQETN